MRLPALPTSQQRSVVGAVCLCLTVIGISPSPGAEEPKARHTLQGHTAFVTSVVFSPDGKTLASASEDKTVKLWEVATGKERATLQGHTAWARSVAFSPDGKILASASRDSTIKLWDVTTGKERTTLEGHTQGVGSVAFSPDGKTLASGSSDKTVKLWDVATSKERATIQEIGHVTFSPDGKTLASASADETLKLLDVATGKAIQGHAEGVRCAAFSPDGKTLASGRRDMTINLWDVATNRERAILQDSELVLSVAFSPDGKTLASANTDETVKLWEVATGKERATLQRFSVAFSPDGKTLASTSGDKTIKLWDIPATKKVAQDLDGLWTTLASEDAANAYQAVGAFVGAPQQAIVILKERLRPAVEPNTRQVARLIADLDSDQFAVRQKCREELEKFGDQAAPALRKKLTEKPALAVRQQIEQLLTKIEQSSETLRAWRAVEVLEHIGTPEARQVLETLATGAEGARLTQETRTALERLNKAAGMP